MQMRRPFNGCWRSGTCGRGEESSLILECSKPDIMSDSIFDDPKISSVLDRFS